jgi:hypothetical protein
MSSDIERSLTMLIHGPSKAGKSRLASTAPYPRLMLDVEMGHKFLPIKVKYWDPLTEDPPIADGTWDTCVVVVRDYDTVLRTYAHLQRGGHQFKSLIIDSITELQVKCLENISGRGQVQMQQWGELLRHMNGLMRDLRDLTVHPTCPLEAVVLTAMSKHEDGMWRPYLQGASKVSAPYFFDITGYLKVEEFPNPDPTQPPMKIRRLLIGPNNEAVAGERVGGRLGEVVEQENLSVERMLDIVYGTPTPVAAPAATT